MRKLSASKFIFPVYATLALLFLLIPIIYTFVFSFNQANRRNTVWQGFTLDNWLDPCGRQDLCDAVGTSLLIAFVSTIIATVLGTALAIALVRYHFRARSAVSLSLFLPMATPEIVMGAGLASLFFSIGIERGARQRRPRRDRKRHIAQRQRCDIDLQVVPEIRPGVVPRRVAGRPHKPGVENLSPDEDD